MRIDLQEALFTKNGEIINDEGEAEERKVEKRLSRQDIKNLIKKRMEKVKIHLDSQVSDIQAEGRRLEDSINHKSIDLKN